MSDGDITLAVTGDHFGAGAGVVLVANGLAHLELGSAVVGASDVTARLVSADPRTTLGAPLLGVGASGQPRFGPPS